ncbi:PLD nuclease N-terminal domain-containing protein [Leucobacter soli]|uniref:PLD nuclease N-terminal domain-containing protein n=1 Tax=Leucobacter soli TaxID=2812850 RepID=UPI00360B9D73
MVRFVIIAVVIGVAFTLYALVDAAMSDARRARGLSKPVWVVLIVLLPVIGASLWFTIGKDRGPIAPPPVRAPDDDPRFSGGRMSDDELDAHMRELEDRLRELDEETFPGEEAAPAPPRRRARRRTVSRARREPSAIARPATPTSPAPRRTDPR